VGDDRFLARFTAIVVLLVIAVGAFLFWRARDDRLRAEAEVVRARLEERMRLGREREEKARLQRLLEEQEARARARAEEERSRREDEAAARAREEEARRLAEEAGPDAGEAPESEGLDRETIRKVAAKGMRGVQTCVEREALIDPSLRPKLVVEFVVGTRGRVTSAKTTGPSTPGSRRFEACVLKVVRSWVFPPPLKPVTVTYPVNIHVVGY